MNDIKGFLIIPSLVDNRDGYTAKFGELSELAETFSRDRRLYDNAVSAPNIQFSTFRYVDSAGTMINPANTAVINRILILGQWIYNQYEAAAIPTQLQNTLFAEALAQEHNFTEVTVGNITSGTTSNKRLPTFVRFKMTEGGLDYQVKIWLSDLAFRQEYDHNQIFVVPPVPSIADLRLNQVGLTTILSTIDVAGHLVDNISAITTKYPQTGIYKRVLEWHDLSNPEITMNTTWTIITYGAAGADTDAQKEAIRNYLATNSNESQWNVIYPSLYSENEFALIPIWDEIAAPETGPMPNLFSPTTTVSKITAVANAKLPAGYGQVAGSLSAHLRNNIRTLPSSYRELMLLAVGNPNNSNNVADIKTLYPDYTGIPSTNADFSRMSADTRAFITMLHSALDVAYNADLATVLPAQFTRSIRSSRLYVCFSLNGFSFMVQSRLSYTLT